MTIKILLHHVLVKLEEATEADDMYRRAKAAGIHLELDKREKHAVEIGTVVQVGPTAFKDLGGVPDLLSVGDKVSITRYSGKKIVDTDGTEYQLVNDEDVLCVIK